MSDPSLYTGAFAAGFGLAVSVFAFASKWWRTTPKAVEPPTAGQRILLVDDDVSAGRLMQRALEPLGVQVVTVESAERAREMLRREGFPLVIVDLRLPGLSGEDLVPYLRPRVLLMSGIDPAELQAAAERCGADEALPKDGNLRTLVATVARMLDRAPPSRQSRPG